MSAPTYKLAFTEEEIEEIKKKARDRGAEELRSAIIQGIHAVWSEAEGGVEITTIARCYSIVRQARIGEK